MLLAVVGADVVCAGAVASVCCLLSGGDCVLLVGCLVFACCVLCVVCCSMFAVC